MIDRVPNQQLQERTTKTAKRRNGRREKTVLLAPKEVLQEKKTTENRTSYLFHVVSRYPGSRLWAVHAAYE